MAQPVKDYSLRKANPADASAMAAVHIKSWLETYSGIMPQKKLDSLNLEASTRNWTNAIESCEIVMVAEADGRVVGFVSGGKNRAQEGCETGLANLCDAELAAMYLLGDYHGLGIGRAMFQAFAQGLKELGYRKMAIWVAAKNHSSHFYQRMGGKLIDRKTLSVCEEDVPLEAYGYELGDLIETRDLQ